VTAAKKVSWFEPIVCSRQLFARQLRLRLKHCIKARQAKAGREAVHAVPG